MEPERAAGGEASRTGSTAEVRPGPAPPRELLTARLRLRPFGRTDLDQLERMFTAPGFRRYLLDDEVVPRDWIAAEIAASRRSFRRWGWGSWAVRRRERRGIVGCCGLREFHRPAVLELYYGLADRYRGRGWATEAAAAVIDDAFGRLAFERVRASVDRPNRASIRVLARLGFVRDPAGGGSGSTLHYRLARARWRARRRG